MNPVEAETLSKIEVLADLEPLVVELMTAHEAKRVLWFPAELLEPAPGEDPDRHLKALRERARGISDPARVALALKGPSPTRTNFPSQGFGLFSCRTRRG